METTPLLLNCFLIGAQKFYNLWNLFTKLLCWCWSNKKLAKDWLSIISKFESLLILNHWTFFSQWNLFLIFEVAVRSKHEECSSERFWRRNHASHASLSSTKFKPRLYYYCILLVRANRSLNSCLTFVPGDTFCRISSELVGPSCNWRVSDVASCLMIATNYDQPDQLLP